MSEQERREQIESVQDRRTGREIARFDRSTEKLRVRDLRGHVWINIRELLDRKRDG
jgi:hypothetical protein